MVLASLYNFADDNTLSAFATTVPELIKILESESEVVIDWVKINKMVVNPDKFQAIILDKRKRDHTDEHITVDNQQIKVVSSVKLLGLQLDDKLNFNLHISNICKSAANQLNALIRLKKFMNFEEKKILINSYFMANLFYSSVFLSVLSRIRTEYGDLICKFPYAVRMLENTDQKNSEYGNFLCSVSHYKTVLADFPKLTLVLLFDQFALKFITFYYSSVNIE